MAAAFMMASCCKSEAPKISIFADHIFDVARQEGVSFAEAAAMVKEIGYRGADVKVDIAPEALATLDSLGFEHACAIIHIEYQDGEQPEAEQKALDFLRENNYKNLLLVPGFLPGGPEDPEFDTILARVKAFAERVDAQGCVLGLEDFDNPTSVCYGTAGLDKFFEAIPTLGHNYDSGNYVYCGIDEIDGLNRYISRVNHTHMKERVAVNDYKSPALGTGIVRFADIVATLQAAGYDGWYTVEHFGNNPMIDDARTSYATMSALFE